MKMGYPCLFSSLLKAKYCDSPSIRQATPNYSSYDLSKTFDSFCVLFS